jgi:hypothetical protein
MQNKPEEATTSSITSEKATTNKGKAIAFPLWLKVILCLMAIGWAVDFVRGYMAGISG